MDEFVSSYHQPNGARVRFAPAANGRRLLIVHHWLLLRPGGAKAPPGPSAASGLDNINNRQCVGIDDDDPAVCKDEEAVAFILRNDLDNARRQRFKPHLLRDFHPTETVKSTSFTGATWTSFTTVRNRVCCSTVMLTLVSDELLLVVAF